MRAEKLLQKILKKLDSINRLYFVAWFFVLFFLFIVAKIFEYTVFDKEFYTTLADRQQIWEVTVPVTRWSIYSDTNDGTILWTSLNLYDIAIDPQVEGSKENLEDFLVEVVYKETCETANREDCYENILKFVKKIEIPEFIYSQEYIKQTIAEYLHVKVNQEFVTSVFIDKELEQEKIDIIQSLGLPWIYPNFPYVYANPQEISNLEYVVGKLAPVMNLDEERLNSLLRQRKIRYVPIMNKLSITASEYVKKYLEEEDIALKSGLMDKEESVWGFVLLNPRPHRYYPEKDIWSQITWFVDWDWRGHYGLEWFFNSIF